MQKRLTALVTGASSGIGYEFAKLLAQRNYNLVLVSRNKEKLRRIKRELSEENRVEISLLPYDLSKPAAAEKLYSDCNKKKINIDVLINNAGSGLFGESAGSNPQVVEAMLNLNIQALTALSSFFGQSMRKRKSGWILNVGSCIGFYPAPFFSSYAAGKTYVFNYTIALRRELRKDHVGVTCLLPGFVKTNFDKNAGITSAAFKKFSEKSGMTAEKIARIGLKGLFRKRAFITAGFQYRLLYYIGRLIPPVFAAWIIHFFFKLLTGGHKKP